MPNFAFGSVAQPIQLEALNLGCKACLYMCTERDLIFIYRTPNQDSSTWFFYPLSNILSPLSINMLSKLCTETIRKLSHFINTHRKKFKSQFQNRAVLVIRAYKIFAYFWFMAAKRAIKTWLSNKYCF